MKPPKRQLDRAIQLRNVAYLAFIGQILLLAIVYGGIGWVFFAVTAYYFWPRGHYGVRGVK